MTADIAQLVPADIVAAFGGFSAMPELVHRRENTVFRVALSNNRPAALRLHRLGYHCEAALTQELQLYEALADAGFACPWPYRTASGEFVHESGGGVFASVLQWVPGQPVGSVPPEDWSVAERYVAIGALLADFHLTTDLVAPKLDARTPWSRDRLLGHGCPWGDIAQVCALTADELRLIAKTRAWASERLAALPDRAKGVIHGDALPDNILRDGATLYLIDLDDSGHGFRAYDLATALICEAMAKTFDTACAALRDGYSEAGGPLRPSELDDIPMFVMLRAQASAAWAATRCHAGDPRQAAYKARALALSEAMAVRA